MDYYWKLELINNMKSIILKNTISLKVLLSYTLSYGKNIMIFGNQVGKTIQWQIECYPTRLGSKYVYGSHLHKWIHNTLPQIIIHSKDSFNTIHNKFSRIRWSLFNCSRVHKQVVHNYIYKCVNPQKGLSIEYNYIHYYLLILAWITWYNISAPAPFGQSCHLHCLKVIQLQTLRFVRQMQTFSNNRVQVARIISRQLIR